MMKQKSFIKKSQIFSLDLIIAIGTFIIILIGTAWVWDYSRERTRSSEQRNDLEVLARQALSTLIETEGNPSNWTSIPSSSFNETNVFSLGLSQSFSKEDTQQKTSSRGLNHEGPWYIDEAKVKRLVLLNSSRYLNYKIILGILGPEYEFSLDVKTWNGTSYNTTYLIGLNPVNATELVQLHRMALMNQNRTYLVMKVWKP